MNLDLILIPEAIGVIAFMIGGLAYLLAPAKKKELRN